jgi:hypothetical protein
LLAEVGNPEESELASEIPMAKSSLTTSGARGLFGRTYVVDVAGTKYSVMDVYIKWGSAIGTGSAGERVVAIFGQAVTDASTGNVNKTSVYENSASLPFQHLNTTWLPGSSSGASSWDSFLTIGCRTQGSGNSAGVKADPFFLNPTSTTASGVAVVTGGSDQLSPPRFVGAGVYQSAPLDSGWETNVATFPDSMILLGRFTLKVSDIVAAGGNVKMKVWTNFTGKSTAQTGGSTLYTISAANLKSDTQTTYINAGQTWTFPPGFEGTDLNQQPWTFATSTLLVPAQYASIQAAIDAAPGTGDWTVAVAPGTYNEAIDFKGKAVTIKAVGARENTIIDGTGLTTSVVRMATGETPSAVLEGFTIRNGPSGTLFNTNLLGGGMFIANASPTVRNCLFVNNAAGYGGGLYGLYSNALVENCTFSQNAASSDGGGLQFFGGAPVIRNCIISDNICTYNGGGLHMVQHVSGGFPTLQNCTITGNRTSAGAGGGVSLVSEPTVNAKFVVTGCTITGNISQGRGGGVHAPVETTGIPKQRVVLSGNTICSNASAVSKRENTWLLFEDGGNVICDCFSDVDGTGTVDYGDIALALLSVGDITDPDFIQPDQDMNGVLDMGDVAMLLLNFGNCD